MIALVSPNLMVRRADRFTTGIIYMPISLAYAAAVLRDAGHDLEVVDAFAASPQRSRIDGDYAVMGLSVEAVCRRIGDADLVVVFANQLINHQSLAAIVRAQKARRPDVPVIVMENTQAVTAYAVRPIAHDLFELGADYVLAGEAERRIVPVVNALLAGDGEAAEAVDGLCTPERDNPPKGYNKELDDLPFPAWDLFPLEGYWSTGFAHGPQSSERYLPLLTSRGCPYPCKFCVVPSTNQRTWRARSPGSVVDEMEHWGRTLGVTEFHVEDLNPTIKDKRIRGLSDEILRRNLDVQWKLVAGTKVESIKNEETIARMAHAGCRYISISPESGSPRMLKLMDKPFALEHAVKMVHAMNANGIRCQACFVLGFPGEEAADRELTRQMVEDLTENGVDEIALFIVSPVPGSAIFSEYSGYDSLSDLNFTPTWREDYEVLSQFRLDLYRDFLVWKLRYHPIKYVAHARNFLRRRFETKMEMVPYKALYWAAMEMRGRARL